MPQQAQFEPQVQPMPQPTMMRNDDPRRSYQPLPTGPSGMQQFSPDGFEDRRMRFAIPTRHMGGEEMMRPRRPRAAYQNYTDTDPAMSTGSDGAPLMGPNSIWPGRR